MEGLRRQILDTALRRNTRGSLMTGETDRLQHTEEEIAAVGKVAERKYRKGSEARS